MINMEFPIMYRLMKNICSPQNRAAGPGLDPEIFFSNPVYQQDCIEDLTMAPRKKYSRYVSELMDRLGYSYDRIKYRQQFINEEWDTLHSYYHKDFFRGTVTTGSKGEGTGLLYESDIDIMYIYGDIICAEHPQHFIHDKNITLFQTETHESSPGYTRLKLIKFDGKAINKILRHSFYESETGKCYLSSQFFIDVIKMTYLGSNAYAGTTSGPSTPILKECVNMDNVFCFRCFCPAILERWVSRRRCQGWPSQDTIQEISFLDAHVVPVGFKGSENMFREWRICYSLAELHLMQNLNETQLKVYIILKKICKSVLNPVCEDMTSYIMKNIVLWMCEANGIARFIPDQLMDRLSDCIIYLRSCVNENNLPSYMIPERNLLASRLDIQQREQLSSLLGDLTREGGRIILRCDKLRDAMIVIYKIPDMFREFSEKRDKIEDLKMTMIKMEIEITRQDMSEEDIYQLVSQNEQYRDIRSHFDHLLNFDDQGLRQKGKTEQEIVFLLQAYFCQLLS